MSRPAFRLLVLIAVVQSLSAQPAVTLADHILWERDFPNLAVSVTGAAVADHAGNLWAVSDYHRSDRLICIRPDGQIVVNTELPNEISPVSSVGGPLFSLAVSTAGAVALVARYSHAVGKAIYFDGAAVATVNSDGMIGPVRKVAGSGPEYKEFVATSDEHFLLIGDQSPMRILRLSSDGKVTWRRTFPANWVLPSAAALENGASCIVSPDYRRALSHLVWIDKNGALQHQEQVVARGSVAASSKGSCTILYDREPGLHRADFCLTSYDPSFKRIWTTPVIASAPKGDVYGVAAVSDGYVVTIGLEEGLFLAKYALGGQPLWAATDGSRQYAALIVPAGDTFYLIGGGLRGDASLHVIRMR
jgi:PQQ-like domain